MYIHKPRYRLTVIYLTGQQTLQQTLTVALFRSVFSSGGVQTPRAPSPVSKRWRRLCYVALVQCHRSCPLEPPRCRRPPPQLMKQPQQHLPPAEPCHNEPPPGTRHGTLWTRGCRWWDWRTSWSTPDSWTAQWPPRTHDQSGACRRRSWADGCELAATAVRTAPPPVPAFYQRDASCPWLFTLPAADARRGKVVVTLLVLAMTLLFVGAQCAWCGLLHTWQVTYDAQREDSDDAQRKDITKRKERGKDPLSHLHTNNTSVTHSS